MTGDPALRLIVSGGGVPLVWLHAFPCSAKMWEGEATYFANRFQVIAPDLPGFGGSEPPAGGFTMAGAARAVHEALVARGITAPVVLGGLSMGGYLAFEYVRAFPAGVRGLILVATKASEDSPDAKAARYKTVESVKNLGMEPFTRMFVPKVLGATTLAERPDVVARVKAMIGEASPEAVMDGLRGLAARRDALEWLPNIACPTLVIAGEEDTLIPVADHQVMAKGIPGAVLETIPRCGHLVNLEAPDRFHAAVDRLVTRWG